MSDTYVFHGVPIVSEMPLSFRMAGSTLSGLEPLLLRQEREMPHCSDVPLWESHDHLHDGQSFAALFRSDQGLILRFAGEGFFVIHPDEIRAYPLKSWEGLRTYLPGTVATWLELVGTPVLHAACVAIGDNGIGMMGNAGYGKSTLSTALASSGHRFFSDEILPLIQKGDECFMYPGLPETHLWPASAQELCEDYSRLNRVYPDAEKRQLPMSLFGQGGTVIGGIKLTCLYLLERYPASEDDAIVIEQMSAPEALLTLVGQSYRVELVQALGLQASRLQTFAKVVRQVPVRRLRYPNGFDHLQRVVDALAADAAAS